MLLFAINFCLDIHYFVVVCKHLSKTIYTESLRPLVYLHVIKPFFLLQEDTCHVVRQCANSYITHHQICIQYCYLNIMCFKNVAIIDELYLNCIFEEYTVCIISAILMLFESTFLRYNIYGDDRYQNIHG